MFTEIAAATKDAALCLTPDAGAANNLKQAFVAPLRLPPISTLSALSRAADKLPTASLAQLVQVAQVAPLLEDDAHHALKWFLYEKLRSFQITIDSARLALADKLAQLFVEMDDHLPLIATGNPFACLSDNTHGSHEGMVAQMLWDETLTAATHLLRRKRAALLRLADHLNGRVVVGVTDDNTLPVEEDFYRQCQAVVYRLSPTARQLQLQEFLSLTATAKTPPATEHLTDCHEGKATSLTDTAALALQAVRYFINTAAEASEARIGVVVYDRHLARRFRAVAEAGGVLIKDNFGWRAETLSFGAALRSFAELAVGDTTAQTMDVCLQPPFWQGNPQRARAAQQWRKLHGGGNFSIAHHAAQPPLSDFTNHLQDIRQTMPSAKATATEWLRWFAGSTQKPLAAWKKDALADSVWVSLRNFATATPSVLNRREFRLWLDDALVKIQCADGNIDSSVEFVTPATNGRFSAVVLLGYTDSGRAFDDGWLGLADRETLNLPTMRERLNKERQQFCRLLADHQRVAMIWQKTDDSGEAVLPHPFWQLLSPTLRAKNNLREMALPTAIRLADNAPPSPAIAHLRQLPKKLPVTSGRYLMECPYRFYMQYILALSDDEAIDDDTLSPRQIGILMHRLLETFSQQTAGITDKAALTAAWQAVLRQALVRQESLAWRFMAEYWQTCADTSFIEWEWQRRQAGWQTLKTEHPITATWRQVRIVGRVDRIDSNAAGEVSVIDYKKGNLPAKKDITLGEQPQLSLNAYLYGLQEEVTVAEQILCQPLHKKTEERKSNEQPRHVVARLRQLLRQMANHADIPANADLQTCKTCSVIGVCRRPHWQTTTQPAAARQ